MKKWCCILVFLPLIVFANGAIHNPFQPAQHLQSQFFTLHYAKAKEVAAMLRGSDAGILSSFGRVIVDQRTNGVWVKDLPARVKDVRRFLQQIDVPLKQVLIKARIVAVDSNYQQQLGVTYGTRSTKGLGLTAGLNMNMPITASATGVVRLALATLGDDQVLDMEIKALETTGHANLLSSPHLITANRQAAYIESGQEIPYQEKTSSGATNVAFKKAVLRLKVTPEIGANNRILLKLQVNQDKVSAIVVNGVPAIDTREVKTQLWVRNGQTIVLGGIYENNRYQQVERVPFLSAIPIIGKLFQSREIKNERKELLVFVTPQIVLDK